MNKFKAFFFSFICVSSSIALGVSFSRTDLAALYDTSTEVVHAKILSSSISQVELNSEKIDCGIDYIAEVSKSYKTELNTISFRSFSQLKMGNEYLLFLDNESLDLNIVFDDMRSEEYKICTTSGPNLFTGWWQGGIFEEIETVEYIGEPRRELTIDDILITKYFKHTSDHTEVDDEINTINIDVEIQDEFNDFISFKDVDFQVFNKNEFMEYFESIIRDTNQ